MTVYLAASWARRAEAAALAAFLRAHGVAVLASWLEGAAELAYYHPADQMVAASSLDLRDVGEADALVALTGDAPDERSHGGKDTEYGVALALGKFLFILGPRQQVHHWNRGVVQTHTREELLAKLAEAER